jgi:hypothetical protein
MPSGFFLRKEPPRVLSAGARLLWFRSKARFHSVGIFAGDESPAYYPNEFFTEL